MKCVTMNEIENVSVCDVQLLLTLFWADKEERHHEAATLIDRKRQYYLPPSIGRVEHSVKFKTLGICKPFNHQKRVCKCVELGEVESRTENEAIQCLVTR